MSIEMFCMRLARIKIESLNRPTKDMLYLLNSMLLTLNGMLLTYSERFFPVSCSPFWPYTRRVARVIPCNV